jgi:hypothetical protein
MNLIELDFHNDGYSGVSEKKRPIHESTAPKFTNKSCTLPPTASFSFLSIHLKVAQHHKIIIFFLTTKKHYMFSLWHASVGKMEKFQFIMWLNRSSVIHYDTNDNFLMDLPHLSMIPMWTLENESTVSITLNL